MFLRSLIKFFINKIRFRNLVLFDYSTDIARNAHFEGRNKVGSGSTFAGYLGRGSYIGAKSEVFARIGRYTSIGYNLKVLAGRHPYTYPFVSTSPLFFSLQKPVGYTYAKKQMFEEHSQIKEEGDFYPVTIGNDCWINANVTVVEGVSIADGAVVLSGAVVTKDVPPYSIVGGVPAKVLSYRYNEEDIKFLLNVKWWNFDEIWLEKNWMLLCDLEEFKNKYKNENSISYFISRKRTP